MKSLESVIAGKKSKITLTLVQDLIDLTKETSEKLDLSESDFVNAVLTDYFEKRGFYKRHSFNEPKES